MAAYQPVGSEGRVPRSTSARVGRGSCTFAASSGPMPCSNAESSLVARTSRRPRWCPPRVPPSLDVRTPGACCTSAPIGPRSSRWCALHQRLSKSMAISLSSLCSALYSSSAHPPPACASLCQPVGQRQPRRRRTASQRSPRANTGEEAPRRHCHLFVTVELQRPNGANTGE